MPRLDNRIAIVTGSDSGIGQAMAEVFAEAGADVAVTFHADEAGAQDTVERVRKAGRRAILRRLDVQREDEVADLFEAVAAELGAPDILVNNAGTGADASVFDMTAEQWGTVVGTDLTGPFLCIQAFARARRAVGGGGKIVNVTSVHEAIPSPGSSAYGAAKGGLLTLTRSLALELAPHRINVNALAPGLIRTPMTADRMNDPEEREKAFARIPWGRAGEPREVALLALYLASDEADYVTGQSFTIDGGLEMNWGQGA